MEKKIQKKKLQSRCHTKRRAGTATCARPSFGMTTTKDIRDIFAYCSPFLLSGWYQTGIGGAPYSIDSSDYITVYQSRHG